MPASFLLPAHKPYHPRSEQLRLLRTELLLRHDEATGANMLAVVSAGAGDGRSQLAAELAICFSQLGQPTLLVDADLRNPVQHRFFNAANQDGLAPGLIDSTRLTYRTVVGLRNLCVLTAGPRPVNPLELLSSRPFEELVRSWRPQFQFVVLDTPPIGQFADALAVATVTRRVLSLSRAGQTSFKDVRNVMRRLEATRSRMLGAVLNHF
ncbi:CpsD/CapB family tyrosine-protein kinase [Pseudomarimonas salicorniae]|uniref:CpsD/CapB family tyrosine-protein kinase n=1 Tax=Pseudomarimonas salicorniae TaxID=2933270 RepID=A0ABT0GGE3_9GAMM|nr:CpsD/CapB family tyrosine-protein kinase [Lysobacter sp. CAU 1642]